MIRRALAHAVAVLLALGLAVPPVAAHERPSRRLKLVTRVFYVGNAIKSKGTRQTCPNATTCDAFGVGKARWTTDATGRLVMAYRYSDAGRPAGRSPAATTVRSAVRAGGAEWNRWNSNVVFVDAGTTDARPGALGPGGSCSDGINTVGWKTFSPRVLGLTSICYDVATMRIQDVDTALNSILRWEQFGAPAPDSKAFDVQTIATHELGHWLSLLDLSNKRAAGQTMFGTAKPGEIRQRTLALGDVVAAQAAYPCGPGDRCPRTGIADD